MRPDDDSIIVLVDEDGNEAEFSITEVLEIGGQRYAVLTPVEPLDDEDCLAVLRVETDEADGTDRLADIEDMEEFERVIIAAEAVLDGLDYCRGCGCTDRYGCPSGCSWVQPGLCSNCAGMSHEQAQGG